MGGPFEGAPMNPLAAWDPMWPSTMPRLLPAMAAVTGAVIAVGAAYVLRGPAKVEEASAAEGQPPNRVT
jgi:hypothetical protein